MKPNALINWKEWQQIADGTLVLEDRLPISRLSQFGDDVWDFKDSRKLRTLPKRPSRLRIEWHRYGEIIPPELLRSAKILGFFFVHYPAILTTSTRLTKQGLSPSYCCQAMKILLSFLAEVYKQGSIRVTPVSAPVYYIQTLADISLMDIEKGLQHWQQPSLGLILRNLLRAFTSPLIQAYLPPSPTSTPPVQWTVHDLKTVDFRVRKQAPKGEGAGFRDKPLPDALFTFLVSVATQDVLSFLSRLGRPCHTPARAPEVPEDGLLSSYSNFGELYEAFVDVSAARYDAVQNTLITGITSHGARPRNSRRMEQYRTQFGISYGAFRLLVERIQMAARYLLLQFTGLRYSEAAMLRVGCVEKLITGDYVIRGTVIKGQSVNSLTGVDYWVACPIVRDAVAALEEIARFTRNNYLFAANVYSVAKEVDVPMTDGAINNLLSKYLHDVDKERKYCLEEQLKVRRFLGVKKPHRLATHRLRHTLALHMARAGLNIPYISFHLKHVYQAHKRFQSVQNVTLGYGGIGTDIFNNAVGIRQATRELVHSVYHPDAPIAGPGAAEFKQNRKFYFTGMLAAGWHMDEIMSHMVKQGLPLADVGLGYCQGRREIEQEDGSKQLPPCLGQLKCNPNQCKNAVIPQSKIPHWQQIYTGNLQHLNDPLLAHARPEYEHFVEEARQVLSHLGVRVEKA